MPEPKSDKPAEPKKLNPREQRELDVTISFLEGIVKRDPEFVDALQLLGDDYTKRGRIEDGLTVDERLAQLRPDDSGVQYNLACSYSLTQQLERAAVALARSIELGYDNYKWISKDPDLKNLRAHPLYEPIRARLRKLKEAAKENSSEDESPLAE